MLELDTRQIATLIWSVITILSLILWPQTRRAMGPAVKKLFEAIAKWKIIIPLASYFAYAAAAIFITYKIDIWHEYPLTDAFLIALFVGLPMFASAFQEKSGHELFRKVLLETIGVYALVAFYTGLAPLSLAGELILLPVIGALTILSVFAGRSPEHKSTKRLFDGVLALIALWLIIRTANIIASSWQIDEASSALDALILSILLPLLLLPAVYIFALIMRYETVFRASKNFNNGKKMRVFTKLACLIGMNVQLGPLNNLGGIWLQKLNEASSFREALGVTSTLKRAYSEKKRINRDRNKRLRKMGGVKGADKNGLQLDRREFYESKHDLQNLLYMQMAQLRNTKRYNPDLPIQVGYSKLPDEHGITMKVRNDKKAWYAWRQMPNGYYFGVGGSPNVDDIWLYDGPDKPNSFPSRKVTGWHIKHNETTSPEWQYDDSPAQIIVPEAYFA